jgi:hypothetical protein
MPAADEGGAVGNEARVVANPEGSRGPAELEPVRAESLAGSEAGR